MNNIKYTDSAQFKCLEHLRQTSLDLYLIHCGKEQCPPSHICPGRRDEYIIHFVLSGKGTYLANGSIWEVKPGQMFLIYPNEPVTYASDSEDPWSYAWIGFNGIQADRIIKNCGFSKKRLVQQYRNADTIIHNVDKILEARQLSYTNDLKRKSYLFMLLSELVDSYLALEPKKAIGKYDYRSNVYVEHAIEYIRFSYQEGINVSDISDYIGISRTYLNHTFQKELGISVQKFLIDFRLHKAANMLTSSDKTVNEVAKSVGYEDPLAFSKAFKKKFEISPKHYRAHQDKMEKFSEKQIDPVPPSIHIEAIK